MKKMMFIFLALVCALLPCVNVCAEEVPNVDWDTDFVEYKHYAKDEVKIKDIRKEIIDGDELLFIDVDYLNYDMGETLIVDPVRFPYLENEQSLRFIGREAIMWTSESCHLIAIIIF